jgi:hypothetical protein
MKSKIMMLVFVMLIAYHPATAQPTAPPPSQGGEMKNSSAHDSSPSRGGEIKKAEIGYWIVIAEQGQRLKIVKTADIVEVVVLSEVYFPGNCVDFTKELTASPYYLLENGKKEFYVEIKHINARGKYRRISNREFEKLTK